VSAPRCPYCGVENDAAAALTDVLAPREGDVSICFACTAIGTFTGEGLEVRRATPAEVAAAVAFPLVVQALALIREREEWAGVVPPASWPSDRSARLAE
jgi:hypothetical protein